MEIPVARLRLAAFGLYGFLLTASAWIHDDAYITFRTVDNFVHGLGLTWNPAERVQAFTHPLWMMLHAALYAVTREIYFTSLALSIALSLALFYVLVFRIASSVWIGVAVGFVLISCKSFVEYSTSGLENPLTHLLLTAFAFILYRKEAPNRIFLLALISGLACLNRMDSLLLFLPALGFVFYQHRCWRNVVAVALGFLPFVAWEVFSLVYYGSLVPNTAHAKLGIGLPRSALLAQGGDYLLYSLLYDPLTLVTIAVATFAVVRLRARMPGLLLAGGLFYVGYVVWIGGGYMGGRFLSAPLLASALALAGLGLPTPTRRQVLVSVALAGVLLLRSATAPLTGNPLEVPTVVDERLRFYHATGLAGGLLSDAPWPNHFFRHKGEYARESAARERATQVVVDAYVGFLGFYAGPNVHIVDLLGLPDPLLARLPGRLRDGVWKPGHILRPLPEGYIESLETGENRLVDPQLAGFYDVVRRVTRGPVWDRDRWGDIWKLHTGGYDDLIEAYAKANPEDLTEPPENLRELFTIDDEEVIRFDRESVRFSP